MRFISFCVRLKTQWSPIVHCYHSTRKLLFNGALDLHALEWCLTNKHYKVYNCYQFVRVYSFDRGGHRSLRSRRNSLVVRSPGVRVPAFSLPRRPSIPSCRWNPPTNLDSRSRTRRRFSSGRCWRSRMAMGRTCRALCRLSPRLRRSRYYTRITTEVFSSPTPFALLKRSSHELEWV